MLYLKPMVGKFRIALAIDQRTMDEWRSYFIAIHRFARTQPDWQIIRESGYAWCDWDTAIEHAPDGILGTLEFAMPPLPTIPQTTRVMIINTSVADHSFGRTVIDDVAAGRLATRYLIGRRLPHYVFVGWSTLGWSNNRQRGYFKALDEANLTAQSSSFNLVRENNELYVPPKDWFMALPKPCAILCANDGLGVRMVEAALECGLGVPDDLSIMGVDDDEVQCAQSPVPLTSIHRDLFAQGYDAARQLDQWLRRDDPTPPSVLHPPGEVVQRESTQMFGETDPIVRRALIMIHTPSAKAITVSDLLERLGNVSRRRLEMKFRQRLGRTPYQEILNARIETAKRLLRSTNYTIDEIAYRTGFGNSAHFSRPFRQRAGCTPSEYRRQHIASPDELRDFR